MRCSTHILRNARICVVIGVAIADAVLVCTVRGTWSCYWLFAVGCWVLLNLYWALASRKMKPALGGVTVGGVTAWLFSLMEFVVYALPLSSVPLLGWRWAPHFATVEVLGAMMCALGVGFAIWSRHVLAGSWNNIPRLRDAHALVTHGPYAIVRHPIYFGFMLSTVGLILVLLEVRALVLFVDLVVFFRKMEPEEKILRQTYPIEYPEYELKVKRLLPFIW